MLIDGYVLELPNLIGVKGRRVFAAVQADVQILDDKKNIIPDRLSKNNVAILDTGSDTSIVDASIVSGLTPALTVSTNLAGASSTAPLYIAIFKIGGIEFQTVVAATSIRFNQSAYSCILGMDFIAMFELTIDVSRKIVRLQRS